MYMCLTGYLDNEQTQISVCVVVYGYQDYEAPWCSISERVYCADGMWMI